MGPQGKGHVDPVVDDEQGAAACRDGSEVAGELEEVAPRQVLLAELDGIDASEQRLLDGFPQGQ